MGKRKGKRKDKRQTAPAPAETQTQRESVDEAERALRSENWFDVCLEGRLHELRTLLDSRDIDVNERNSGGITPLMLASERGHLDAVRLLIERGAELNSQRGDGVSPLYLAAMFGHKETAQLLVQTGAEIDIQDENGITTLWMACNYNRASTARLRTRRVDLSHWLMSSTTAASNSLFLRRWQPILCTQARV